MAFKVRIDPDASRAIGASGLGRDDVLVVFNRIYDRLETASDAQRGNRYRKQPELFHTRVVRALPGSVHIFHLLVDDLTEPGSLTVVYCFHETRDR